MISEIADTFLRDFGVTVEWGTVSALGVLDCPDQIVGDFAISSEYAVTVEAATFDGISRGSAITVDDVDYTVREYRKIDDGKFAKIVLNKT